MTLDQCPPDSGGTITRIDWQALGLAAGRRLRAMGFEVGERVETLRQGGVALVKVGRMTIAIRAGQAAHIEIA